MAASGDSCDAGSNPDDYIRTSVMSAWSQTPICTRLGWSHALHDAPAMGPTSIGMELAGNPQSLNPVSEDHSCDLVGGIGGAAAIWISDACSQGVENNNARLPRRVQAESWLTSPFRLMYVVARAHSSLAHMWHSRKGRSVHVERRILVHTPLRGRQHK